MTQSAQTTIHPYMWEHGEEEIQKFLETLNCYHPTIKFTAEHCRAKINFLDVTVIKKGNQLVTDLYIKPTDTHQYLHASRAMFLIVKNQYLSVKPCILTEFVLKTRFLMNRVMNISNMTERTRLQ